MGDARRLHVVRSGRRRKFGWAIFLDKIPGSRADYRGVPILLLHAGLGIGDRVCGMGRCAVHWASSRIVYRGWIGSVAPVA